MANKTKVEYREGRLLVNSVPALPKLRGGRQIVLLSEGNDPVEVAYIPCPQCANPTSANFITPGRLLLTDVNGEKQDRRCNRCLGKGKLFVEDIKRAADRLLIMRQQGLEVMKEMQSNPVGEFKVTQSAA